MRVLGALGAAGQGCAEGASGGGSCGDRQVEDFASEGSECSVAPGEWPDTASESEYVDPVDAAMDAGFGCDAQGVVAFLWL